MPVTSVFDLVDTHGWKALKRAYHLFSDGMSLDDVRTTMGIHAPLEYIAFMVDTGRRHVQNIKEGQELTDSFDQ